jgi:hypothetical protein
VWVNYWFAALLYGKAPENDQKVRELLTMIRFIQFIHPPFLADREKFFKVGSLLTKFAIIADFEEKEPRWG